MEQKGPRPKRTFGGDVGGPRKSTLRSQACFRKNKSEEHALAQALHSHAQAKHARARFSCMTFLEKYFSKDVKNKKEMEFLELK
ncbi:hypothetical protein CR513_15621, partial [Mucuna pruriens]